MGTLRKPCHQPLGEAKGDCEIVTANRYRFAVSEPEDRSILWRRSLVVGGLSVAAVAAPLLDVYGRNPETFIANRTSPTQIVLFAFLVTFGVPILGLGLLAAARLVGPRTSQVTYFVLLIALAVGTGLVVSRQAAPETTLWAIAIAAGVVGLIFLLHRYFAEGMRFFAVALPVVMLLFLFTSDTAALVWDEADEAPTGSETVDNPQSILFIQLDEFPTASIMDSDGTVNEALFPNFARLEAEGTWYRNALSASIATTQSVPSILTGRLWEDDRSPTAFDHPNNLFTLLADSHEMHVIEWVAELCPETTCPEFAGRAPAQFSSLLQDVGVVYGHLTLPAAARGRLPAIDNSWKGFLGQDNDSLTGDRVPIDGFSVPDGPERSPWIDWLQRIINGIAREEPPTLHYAHLRAPHVPWEVNPSGTHYFRPEEYSEVDGVETQGRWVEDPRYPVLGLQRHLFQVGFLDAMLGSAFERLDRTGNWDQTMIVVVADHGASFEPGEHRRWPYDNNRDDLYRVPLFVKYPGQTSGSTRDEPAFTIDILPTIVDSLEIETNWEFDGISLLDLEGTNREHRVIHWCCSSQPASTDLLTLLSEVDRNHEWIPNQRNWTEVAAVGPYASMVGRSVDDLDVVTSEGLRWSIDHGELIDTVDRSGGLVQTMIAGPIQLPEGVAGDDLLVTANGVIAGTGFYVRDTASSGQMRAIVSEDLLVDGDNNISILVPGEGGIWLTGARVDISLEYRAESGRVLDIRPEGNRRIQIDDVDRTDTGWVIEGWSADISRKEPPDMMYVFAGQTLIAAGPPNLENRNVVRWYNSDDLLLSGFHFEIADTDLSPGVERLTIIAEYGSQAIADTATLG